MKNNGDLRDAVESCILDRLAEKNFDPILMDSLTNLYGLVKSHNKDMDIPIKELADKFDLEVSRYEEGSIGRLGLRNWFVRTLKSLKEYETSDTKS